MKYTLVLSLFLLSIPGFSQTQAELNANSSQKLKKIESELSAIENKILNEYKEDKEFVSMFTQAQEKWKEYRDAQLRMKYPKRSPGWYGSNHSMCINLYLTQLNRDRIEFLNEWLRVSEEGDACRGSVK